MATTADLHLQFPNLSVAIAGKTGITQSGSGNLQLPEVQAILSGMSAYTGPVGIVVPVTSPATSDGSMIFQFQGKPNTAVEWAIAVGSGSITALTNSTDSFGRAFAVYAAGGYVGPLTVEATYVA